MPVGKEMFQHEEAEVEWEDEEDILGEARPGTTKRKQYYAKKVIQNGYMVFTKFFKISLNE